MNRALSNNAVQSALFNVTVHGRRGAACCALTADTAITLVINDYRAGRSKQRPYAVNGYPEARTVLRPSAGAL